MGQPQYRLEGIVRTRNEMMEDFEEYERLKVSP